MSEDPLPSRKDYELVIVSCGEVDELVGRLSGPNSSLLRDILEIQPTSRNPSSGCFFQSYLCTCLFSFSLFLPPRLFGQDGLCASCDKRIRAYEMTMRVKDKVYHLECFKCAACQKHFCVGDRYLLINSDIVCEQDIYEWTKINGMI